MSKKQQLAFHNFFSFLSDLRHSNCMGWIMRKDSFGVLIAFALGALGFGLSACASSDSAATGSDAKGSQSSVERYFDDAGVTTKVKAELVKDVGAKAATEVTVTTEKGVVQLAGFASSRDEADRAVAAAKQVSGVRDVKDDIRIKQ